MIDTLQPRDGVVVVWTNHRSHGTDEVYSGAELLDLEAPMGGGTYMTAGVEWLEHNGLDSDLTMVFTDGEMYDDDWASLGRRDNLVVVLDSQPTPTPNATSTRAVPTSSSRRRRNPRGPRAPLFLTSSYLVGGISNAEHNG